MHAGMGYSYNRGDQVDENSTNTNCKMESQMEVEECKTVRQQDPQLWVVQLENIFTCDHQLLGERKNRVVVRVPYCELHESQSVPKPQ